MANYHVTKVKGGKGWKAKREKAERAAAILPTQAKAEKLAKKLSKKSGGGEVRVHRPKGKIRDSDTMPPKKDPNPPKDKKH